MSFCDSNELSESNFADFFKYYYKIFLQCFTKYPEIVKKDDT